MNEVLTPAASWIVRITGNSDFAEFEKRFGKDPNARAKRKTGDSKENRCRSFTVAIAEVEAAVDELNSIATMLEPNGNGTGKVEAATDGYCLDCTFSRDIKGSSFPRGDQSRCLVLLVAAAQACHLLALPRGR
jgi:hypothetical protein